MVSTKVQQSSLGVYYAIGDILILCLRYRSYSTKVQQSSLGVYYAIGVILLLCLRYRSYYLYAYVVSSTVQQSSIVVLKMSTHVR